MPETDSTPKPPPFAGSIGLSMLAPVVGLPLFIHALGGAIFTGLGVAAASTVMLPFAGKMLLSGKGIKLPHPVGFKEAYTKQSVTALIPEAMTVPEPVNEEC